MPVIEHAERAKTLPPPPHVVWADLVDPRTEGPRPWMVLEAGETTPRVLESVAPTLVVWSSLWPDRPDDQVRLELSRAGAQTRLRVVLLSPEPPDGPISSAMAHRVSQLLFNDLRLTYGG